MGVPDHLIRGSVRFSFGRFNDESDVDEALKIVPKVIGKLREIPVSQKPVRAELG
jgi:cysteine desulfurase